MIRAPLKTYIMMKPLLYICCYFLIIAPAVGQDTLISQAFSGPKASTFEDRDTSNYFYIDTAFVNNIWQIGLPSKNEFDQAYSVPLALVTDTLLTYSTNNRSVFEFVVTSDDATDITFWHKWDTDSLTDGGVVEASFDGGNTWTNVIDAPQFYLLNFYSEANTISSNDNKPGFTGASDWVQSRITGYAFNYIRFRFTFTSDNIGDDRDGWMIDDFVFLCTGTSIEDQINGSTFRVFPNPATDAIFVETDKPLHDIHLRLSDLCGHQVLTGNLPALDVSTLPKGMYLLEIDSSEGRYIKRVVLQ